MFVIELHVLWVLDVFLYSKQNQFDFGVLGSAVPLYTQSKQACSYKPFTRQSCPTFSLCESAAGLRCIIHEHSVNLLIQNMSSLLLCLIYYLSVFFVLTLSFPLVALSSVFSLFAVSPSGLYLQHAERLSTKLEEMRERRTLRRWR